MITNILYIVVVKPTKKDKSNNSLKIYLSKYLGFIISIASKNKYMLNKMFVRNLRYINNLKSFKVLGISIRHTA